MKQIIACALLLVVATTVVASDVACASNSVGGLLVVAECPTEIVAWTQAMVIVRIANTGTLWRRRHDYDSDLDGVRVLVLDSQGQMAARTKKGMDFMTPTGEASPGPWSYRGRSSLNPGATAQHVVDLSEYFVPPTSETCSIKITFDTDIENPTQRIVVADLWADTNLWGPPDLYVGPGDPPITNWIAASYDKYGAVVTNTHVEVTGLVIRVSRQ